MLNPFDLKAALAAKHAQHVVLIHFPIALFIAGAAFDFLAHWTKKQGLAAAAYCNFLVAAVASVPTMITGLLAWQWQLEGQRLKGTLLTLLFARKNANRPVQTLDANRPSALVACAFSWFRNVYPLVGPQFLPLNLPVKNYGQV